MCINRKVTGIDFDGGYAEYMIAPAWHWRDPR